MGYRSLVEKQVDNAFKLIGDLAYDAYFYSSKATDFDFTTGEVDSTSEKLVGPIKVVMTEKSSLKTSSGTKEGNLIFPTKSFPSISDYDRVRILGLKYSIQEVKNNSFTTEVKLYRE